MGLFTTCRNTDIMTLQQRAANAMTTVWKTSIITALAWLPLIIEFRSGPVMILKAFHTVSLPLFLYISTLLICQRKFRAWRRDGSPADHRTKHACKKKRLKVYCHFLNLWVYFFTFFPFNIEVLLPSNLKF